MSAVIYRFKRQFISDDIEKMAPPPVHSSTSEWSVSLEDVSRRMDEDDDDDDEDMFKTIYVWVRLPHAGMLITACTKNAYPTLDDVKQLYGYR